MTAARRLHPSLSRTLLLVIVAFGLALVAVAVAQQFRAAQRDMVAEARRVATLMGSFAVASIEDRLRAEPPREPEGVLDRLRSDPAFEAALLSDGAGAILAASAPALRRARLADTPLAGLAPELSAAREQGRPVIRLSQSGQAVHGLFPVVLPGAGSAGAPGRQGVLVLSLDLTPEAGRIRREALAGLAILGGSLAVLLVALWLALHWLLVRRARLLLARLPAFERGETRLPPELDGRDELGSIARALAAMAARTHERAQALAETEERFRRAVMDAPFPMILHQEGGRVMLVNQAWTDATGYGHGDLPTMQAWAERVHAASGESVLERIERLYELERRVDEGELAVRTASGGELVWQFSSAPLGSGPDGRRQAITAAVDVTVRRRAERAALRRSRAFELLSAVGESLVRAREERLLLTDVCRHLATTGGYRLAWVGLLGGASEGRLIPVAEWGRDVGYLHRVAADWTDLGAEQGPTATAVGTGETVLIRDIAAGEDSAGWRRLALERGFRCACSLPLRMRSGVVGALSVYARQPDAIDDEERFLLLKLADDLAYGLESLRNRAERDQALASLRRAYDDQERRVAERTRELAAANARLAELDQLKSMFIASMSHELRTPLNSIIGFTGMILTDMAGPVSDEQRGYLQRVYTSGQHLLGLITDVIDISKIEAGKIEPWPTAVELGALAEEALSLVGTQAGEQGVRVEQEVPRLELVTDRKRLLQCLLNLLGNAIKYAPGGRVWLRAEDEGPRVRILVADEGPGIPPAEQPLLFAPFVRLDSGRARNVPGTGLGLYLTRKLAEQVLDGEVGVDSAPGRGSTFWLRVARRLRQD